jgi:hypothetical protein
MQMVVPDYWKGRGRYSKQVISRKVKDESSFQPPDEKAENQDES